MNAVHCLVQRVPAGVKYQWDDIVLAQNGAISYLACIYSVISTGKECCNKQFHSPSLFQDPSTTAYYGMYFENKPLFTHEEIFSHESAKFSTKKLDDIPAPTLAKFP